MLNPYNLVDPKLKSLRNLMREITSLGNGLGEENEELIQSSLESLCSAFGVELVECSWCDTPVAYVFTTMCGEGTYVCLKCWNSYRRKSLEYAKILWQNVLNGNKPTPDNEEIENEEQRIQTVYETYNISAGMGSEDGGC